jgi:tRNA pseudouridine38-40 synthase
MNDVPVSQPGSDSSERDDEPRHPYGVALIVSYDGTRFHGFQRQEGLLTVQGELERAASEIAGHPVRVRGAGRTDAGVHAVGQVAAFACSRSIRAKGWRRGLSTKLPYDIRIVEAWECGPRYEPRFDALGKTYRYVLEQGEVPNPMWRDHVWWIGRLGPLSLASMRAAARVLEGKHDFRAFRSADDQRENTLRTMWSIDVIDRYMNQPNLIAIEVRGTAFMKNMVRIMAGTLVDVGRGRRSPADVRALLTSDASRIQAGMTAPARGLVLVEVRLGRLAAIEQGFDTTL